MAMTGRMKHVRLIIKSYLNEASIHGLKYLASGASLLSRLLWTAAIVCCFAAALTSFMQAMDDWNEVPLVTTIQTINQPLDSIPLPTVTVCSSRTQNKKHGFQGYLLNGLKLACSGEDSDCEDTIPIRKVLRPQMRKALELFYERALHYYYYYMPRSVDEQFLKAGMGVHIGVDSEIVSQMLEDDSTKDLLFYEIIDNIGKPSLVERIESWLLAHQPKVTINQASDISMSKKRGLESVLTFFNSNVNTSLGDLLFHVNADYSDESIESLYAKMLDDIKISTNSSLGNLSMELQRIDKLYPSNCDHFEKEQDNPFRFYYSGVCWSLRKYSSAIIMLMSKYETDHHGFYDSPRRFLAQFNVTNSLAGFPLKTDTADFQWDQYSSIQFCTITKGLTTQPVNKDLCEKFLPIPTNNGICYAFNALHGFQMVNQSGIFYEDFRKTYQSEYHLHADMEMPLEMASDGKTLSFWITNFNNAGNKPKEPLEIGISDVWNSFDFSSRSSQIEMGTDTIIYIQPFTQISIGIDHLPLETRKCRFNHEVIRDRLSIFGFYSYKTCLYECIIVAIIEHCGCIPPNIAYSSKSITHKVPICFDVLSSNCFSWYISTADSLNIQSCKENRCLPDCSSTKFEVSRIEKNHLDINSECLNNRKTVSYQDSGPQASGMKAFPIRKPHKNLHIGVPHEICESQNYSRITVKMASHSFTQFKQTPRVDLHGKISQLGGTMGLFTGMSFLSFLEAAFWLLKLLPY